MCRGNESVPILFYVIVADDKDVQLEPGMSSSVEIKAERRQILSIC